MMSPQSIDDHHHHVKKKRVGKACDSCRIKKTKCDGKKPCSRCIADNKFCAFTEKKKTKEKSYPAGYVELLETRLNIVTKSLEQIVRLAEPHLPFLAELMATVKAEHSEIALPSSESLEPREANYVPINEVVEYLMNNLGLLDKEPVAWEKGAKIAARLVPEKMDLAAAEFSEKRSKSSDFRNSASADNSPDLSLPQPMQNASFADPKHFGGPVLLETQFSNSYFPEQMSAEFPLPNDFSLDEFPKRANSIFIRGTEMGSSPSLVLLMTNRLESANLDDQVLLRRSLSGSRSRLPSLQKQKMSGHVHKPLTSSHHLAYDRESFFLRALKLALALELSLPDFGRGHSDQTVGSMGPMETPDSLFLDKADRPVNVEFEELFDPYVDLNV